MFYQTQISSLNLQILDEQVAHITPLILENLFKIQICQDFNGFHNKENDTSFYPFEKQAFDLIQNTEQEKKTRFITNLRGINI